MSTNLRLYTLLIISALLMSLASCRSLTESAKYGLQNGYYRASSETGENRPVYVYVHEDTLMAFPVRRLRGQRQIDTSRQVRRNFPEVTVSTPPEEFIIKEYSYDLDVLAIPFKYRPREGDMPRQLTTQLNGALYTGFRTDRYRVSYESTPIGRYRRDITHYGYSIGIMTGIGAETITPWVTQDRIPGEYDGVVWLNGLGAIIGINNFTFGMALGMDYLLDSNRRVWIYQTEPWFGLTFGLNLN